MGSCCQYHLFPFSQGTFLNVATKACLEPVPTSSALKTCSNNGPLYRPKTSKQDKFDVNERMNIIDHTEESGKMSRAHASCRLATSLAEFAAANAEINFGIAAESNETEVRCGCSYPVVRRQRSRAHGMR